MYCIKRLVQEKKEFDLKDYVLKKIHILKSIKYLISKIISNLICLSHINYHVIKP